MLVSVVVPTLNEGRCLEKCLSSFADGKLKTEIIVVDGGSADGTREIARKYADKVFNLKARGIGTARQFGLENARGKYVYMTDADCWSGPLLLANMVKVLEERSAIAVTGPTKYDGIGGKLMQAWYYFFDKYWFRYKYGTFGLSGRNTLFRRHELLAAIRGVKMPNFWEDGFMTFRLKKYGETLYDDRLYNFSLERRLSDSMTLLRTIRTYRKGMREFAEKGNIISYHLPLTSGRESLDGRCHDQ